MTEKATQDDIFGDDLSISSEDEDDAKAKKSVIREDDDDEVARYDDEGGAKKLTIDSDSDNEGETRYIFSKYHSTQEAQN